ncbi:MAG: Unknown protein [uncultured Thiotrichaceae bacterium]|uniref:DUF72 domain-containing protein n=1 Tax=uncultured Thiotrichaceae bacterium TaxID=298394 RepID=A0A6S6SFH2_9GAMM|nr:MAG: Unknown protein [uncultured Thiotrichaceae bacterium]
MRYYIGLPEWRHPDWYAEGKNPKKPLNIYARHFTAVEGNTSFYALPSVENISAWNAAVPEGFKFCFKFPKTITHDQQLRHCSQDVKTFLERVAPLESKLGILWLQMRSSFSVQYLPNLRSFLDALPEQFNYGIEVRNHSFFAKNETERAFNQLLIEYDVNRVMFDTRIFFANASQDADSQDALKKKPRMPLHVIATSDKPMLRFIAPMEITLADVALDQWANKVIEWVDEGKTPYLFFHSPNNHLAPQLALLFSQKVAKLRPDMKPISLWNQQPQQNTLF